MTLAFVDADDNEGRIHDDFDVEYDGPETVGSYVDEVIESVPTEEQAVEHILLDIVHDLNVEEVRRE